MTFSALVGLPASFWLAYWSGDAEPFFGPFNARHAAISIVGGGIGLLFWSAWAVCNVVAIMKRWWSTATLGLMLLAVLGLFLNAIVVYGYIGDRQNWIENGPF